MFLNTNNNSSCFWHGNLCLLQFPVLTDLRSEFHLEDFETAFVIAVWAGHGSHTATAVGKAPAYCSTLTASQSFSTERQCWWRKVGLGRDFCPSWGWEHVQLDEPVQISISKPVHLTSFPIILLIFQLTIIRLPKCFPYSLLFFFFCSSWLLSALLRCFLQDTCSLLYLAIPIF